MSARFCLSLAISLTLAPIAAAQPGPPELPRSAQIVPAEFDAAKFRAAVAFPISSVQYGILTNNGEKEEELPPVSVIEKKLVGDQRDAEWLVKLGDALSKDRPEQAKRAYEKSVAAFRKRIEKEPKVAKHYYDLVWPLGELGRPAEELAAAKKCVELDPKCADGWAALRDCYWEEFRRLVYGDAEKVSWHFSSDRPPPEIVRPLTAAQKDQARALLEEIGRCHREWKRFTPDTLDSASQDILLQSQWELFQAYFRTGDWDLNNPALYQGILSSRLRERLIEQGKQKEDPAALGMAVFSQIAVFATETNDPDWTMEKMTAEQKTALASTLQPLEKLAEHKDPIIAMKANFILAALSGGDAPRMMRLAARALELAPCEGAVVDLMTKAQAGQGGDFKQFWLDHLRKHPSVRPWLNMAEAHFKANCLADADRCLREAEKLDPKDRTVQLARAAVALKSGDDALAARILDALQSRLEEAAPEDPIFHAKDVPGVPDAYRYLRAVHDCLNGKCEQGRAQFSDLCDKKIFAEAITEGLAAYRPAVVLLPLPPLNPAPASALPAKEILPPPRER